MRTYLPIDRDILPPGWPLSKDNTMFWEELRKTVAAFGYLQDTLTSAYYSVTAPPTHFDSLRPNQIEAYLKRYAKVEAFRADTLA